MLPPPLSHAYLLHILFMVPTPKASRAHGIRKHKIGMGRGMHGFYGRDS